MSDDDPVTQWLTALKAQDHEAAGRLWNAYCDRVAKIARRNLAGAARADVDEQDIAQSAFRSFFRRTEKGCFPRLDDRDDLWKLLVTITIRKAWKQRRKRGHLSLDADQFLAEHLGEENSHEFAVEMREEIGQLCSLLDARAQLVVALLLEGHTNEEIASKLDVALATVERKRKLIRETWQRRMQE